MRLYIPAKSSMVCVCGCKQENIAFFRILGSACFSFVKEMQVNEDILYLQYYTIIYNILQFFSLRMENSCPTFDEVVGFDIFR